MTIQRDDLTLFGQQLENVFRFMASDCSSDELVIDHVDDGRKLPLASLFDKKDELWVMRSASLPGDTAIKAVACNTEALFLETSPLVENDLATLLREKRLPFDFDPANRKFTLRGRENGHATYSLPEIPELPVSEKDGGGTVKLEPRVMWEVKLNGVDKSDREDVLRLFDTLDGAGAFAQGEEDEPSRPTAQKQEIKLNLSLQMRIVMEQRPILLLRHEMQQRPEMRTEIRMELSLQQLLKLEQFARQASEAQIYASLDRIARTKNLGMAVSVFAFLLARPIKEKKQCDWKTARKIARPIAYQAIASSARVASASN